MKKDEVTKPKPRPKSTSKTETPATGTEVRKTQPTRMAVDNASGLESLKTVLEEQGAYLGFRGFGLTYDDH